MRRKQVDVEAVQRDYTEKLLATAEFYKANKIYAFRKPDKYDREVMTACGDDKLFMPPNPPQEKLFEAWADPSKKVFTFTGGNRSGKTTAAVISAMCIIKGEFPWSGEKIPFKHKRARKVRYIGQGWESNVKTVVIPALRLWWPKSWPVETKKNNQGVDAVWKDLITGGVIEIMSNSQESDVFEGWEGDAVIYDEPPKRDVRVACARGLIDRAGRELFAATLLKEAWIHREIIKGLDKDGRPDASIYNIHAQIYDNVGYGIDLTDVEQFAKTLRPEELETRLRGVPADLLSLVFPKFSRDKHIKEPFKIPLDWIVDIAIDFHPSKKWAVSFLATARNNFKYICKEIWQHGNPKFIAEEIIRVVRQNDYRVGRCIIDPLAKSGMDNDNDVFTILSDVLGAHRISLEVASKDKDNGIAVVNSLLWSENEMPGLYYFRDCPKSITQTEDLMFDPDNLKPTAMKVEDDFTENLYRLALLDTQWFPPMAYDVSTQKSMML